MTCASSPTARVAPAPTTGLTRCRSSCPACSRAGATSRSERARAPVRQVECTHTDVRRARAVLSASNASEHARGAHSDRTHWAAESVRVGYTVHQYQYYSKHNARGGRGQRVSGQRGALGWVRALASGRHASPRRFPRKPRSAPAWGEHRGGGGDRLRGQRRSSAVRCCDRRARHSAPHIEGVHLVAQRGSHGLVLDFAQAGAVHVPDTRLRDVSEPLGPAFEEA